jgi:diphthamide biosynthesis protein 3
MYHDEVEIEDFEYDEELEMYFYPCPCGDRFQISKVSSIYTLFFFIAAFDHFTLILNLNFIWKEDLENGEETATCPSCSLLVKVIYDKENFMKNEKKSLNKATSESSLKVP